MGSAEFQLNLDSRPMKICQMFILKSFFLKFLALKSSVSCVGVGRWPAGRCVVLFVCVFFPTYR